MGNSVTKKEKIKALKHEIQHLTDKLQEHLKTLIDLCHDDLSAASDGDGDDSSNPPGGPGTPP